MQSVSVKQTTPSPMNERTDLEIVEQTNDLARLFYRIHDRGGGVEKGYRFDLSEHPQEQQCWKMACVAQELLTETDVTVAIDNLEGEI